MTLFQRMVEEGARAIAAHVTIDTTGRIARVDADFPAAARAALTAALALAEGEGAILTVVPSRAVMPNHPLVQNVQGIGWNACRAAVLAGKVTL